MLVRDGNRIVVSGEFGVGDLHRPMGMLHQAIQNAGYEEIVLDFSNCVAAFPAPMLALCAKVTKLRQANIDFDLIPPGDKDKQRLFVNTNWAHLLCPRKYDPSDFKGYSQIPATQFSDPTMQQAAVNRIVNSILGAIPDIQRSNFAALEWSINEITDNVLVHAESSVGGFVQVSIFKKNRKKVQFIVVDAGRGIPMTLRESHSEIRSDVEALDSAIREGVTRDKSVGQGNGLYGSFQICSHSGGFFEIASGWATLIFRESSGLKIDQSPVPYDGTVVIAEIDFTNPDLLAEALKIGGKVHRPVDYVETRYEMYDRDDLHFKMIQESSSFGSRVAGTPVRTKLINLITMCPDQRIVVDFDGVPLVSSSFADEVVGKLFVELGPMKFGSRLQFIKLEPIVEKLINKAIAQRMSTG